MPPKADGLQPVGFLLLRNCFMSVRRRSMPPHGYGSFGRIKPFSSRSMRRIAGRSRNGAQGVVAKEGGPPLARLVLEDHVMPAVRDGQVAGTVRAVNVVDSPDQPQGFPLLQIRRLPDADPFVRLPPRWVAGRSREIVHPVAANTDRRVAEREVEERLKRRQRYLAGNRFLGVRRLFTGSGRDNPRRRGHRGIPNGKKNADAKPRASPC